jgi:hypothetical protein
MTNPIIKIIIAYCSLIYKNMTTQFYCNFIKPSPYLCTGGITIKNGLIVVFRDAIDVVHVTFTKEAAKTSYWPAIAETRLIWHQNWTFIKFHISRIRALVISFESAASFDNQRPNY